MKKKILIITTGGTIAMKKDSDFGVVPANELIEFLTAFPQLSNDFNIELYDFCNIPSPHITPETMLELAQLIDLKIIDFDGIVVTHGTDTLEETAFFLDLILTIKSPVVLTAAMRSGSDLGLDGPRNIIGSVRVATSSEAVGKGVLVVMNDEIHSARDVIKTDTGKVSSFSSLEYGLLGNVDADRIIFHRKTIQKEKIQTQIINTNIDLIRCTAGMSDRYIKNSMEHDAKAIVIEAFGRGNVPPGIVPAIEEAIAKNIIVLIVSRAYTGRVMEEYGYIGGGKHLQKIGAVLGGDLKGHKARLKLMMLFGKYKDPQIIKRIMKNER